jgi:hypothetical protein
MNIREFTKEEIPKAISNWIESLAYNEDCVPFEIDEVIKKLRSGAWLKELEKQWKLDSYTPPHWNS